MPSSVTTLAHFPAGILLSHEKPGESGTRRRRVRFRRRMLGYICLSYVVDAVPLALFAATGTISVAVLLGYLFCGLGSALSFAALSETRLSERFNDPFMVIPQALTTVAILLLFAWLTPAAGFLFVCNLFIVVGFSSLRASAREAAVTCLAIAVGLLLLLLGTDTVISLPQASAADRAATVLAIALTVGRCMFVGIFSSSLRKSLYNRSIQLQEAYRRIEELAELDELTGAYNRRSIMRMLDSEVVRAHQQGIPCSVALIDLDWFKRINDAHGHPIGDEVLRTFAITVFANVRDIDRFGRYGGEEFILVLPETSASEATAILERLRLIIAELDWGAFSTGMAVTISAGVAELKPDETLDSLLRRVDAALYAAKGSGRNQILRA